ncbi:hypothetical protein EUGRSUZ_C03330 [Eucalyptus grandis]|uniref:Uncharacterized protein n=1 Tax=Eucalyptus grandis TaxID=71139 RepID=A0ACC3LI88_EUCGR|nr:hypothetical protein EUGRSUZ_C03330 [Eucalyptus grandis]
MKKKALWVLVVVWGIACLCGSRGCREQERVALLALNATLDLPYWVDVGGSYFNCCSWEGVECNPTTGRVTQLMLSNSRYYRFGFKTWYLNASLLLPFEELKSFDLSYNYLGGWIAPKEPNLLSSKLSKLEVLDLSYNSLNNSILPILGGFSNLKELDISHNKVDAVAITEGIKNLSHLEELCLDGVHLKDVGTILQALGALSSLKILSLQNSTIEGTITAQDNNLQGEIVFSNDSMKLDLLIVRLDHNLFTGSLSIFLPSDNLFIGKLPRLITNLSSLVALDLSKNQLDGIIPQELFNLEWLVYLDLSDNNLSGPLQSFFMSQRMSHIHLNRNKLNGSIVHVLSNSSHLVTLDLSENEFSGSIPYWLGNLSQLSILSLRGNSFVGTFPKQLCNLKSLSMIDLSENNLFGPLPSCLGPMNFSSSGYADKSISTPMGTTITGWLPSSYVRTIKSHTKLFSEELEERAFRVPQTVGFTTKGRFDSYKGYALLKMVGLDLSCNQFSGEIPPEIAILQDMLVLNLSNNKLTGHIPTSLSSLTKIESMTFPTTT